MSRTPTEPRDAPPLDGYETFRVEADVSDRQGAYQIGHAVYDSGGDGAPVLLLHELPGMTPECLDLASRLRGEGFRVLMPLLFGEPGRTDSLGTLSNRCVRRDFAAWRRGDSGPVGDWFRGLVREVSDRAGGRAVGVIGMCMTGNFAVMLLAEPEVGGAVTCQPAPLVFPLFPPSNRADLGLSEAELEASRQRAEAMPKPALLGYRFASDLLSPRARFRRLEDVFGDSFRGTEIPDLCFRHAVLTLHYSDKPESPTRKAFEEITAFFRDRLG
ncbi:MAG: dienelactone hydrolase family protein [Minwuia sp.]|uniref:dienelactone hydrolase family protein n=1 Tax=Minwuia sp. TaxID=2493630 RepID=UPI003A83D93D